MKRGIRSFLGSDLFEFFPPIAEKPWPYFLFFLVDNALLSYGSFGISQKIILGIIGLALPLLIGSDFFRKRAPKPFPTSRSLFVRVPGWLWTAVFILSIVLRLIPLLGFDWLWPDDGLNTLLPIELSKAWHWQFSFMNTQQVPPLYYWVEGLYFKLLEPSLFSARLFQFMLSVLAVGLFGFLSRKIQNQSLGFLAWALFSLGFFSLFCSRFLFSMNFILVWGMLVFLVLFRFTGPLPEKPGILWAAILGGLVGLGPWISLLGLLVPLIVFLFLARQFQSLRTRERWVISLGFAIPFLFFTVPYFFAFFVMRLGGDFNIQWLLWREMRLSPLERLDDIFSNLTCVFWTGNHSYSSSRGGMFNPLEGAFCITGLALIKRSWKATWVRWFAITLAIFMIPGFLSNAYEIFHILLAVPLLYFMCATGANALLLTLPQGTRWLPLVGFLLFSGLLGATQLLKTYSGVPTVESRAFEILDRLKSEKGPGFILLDLRADDEEHGLPLATYPFNAAENPKWSHLEPRWAAVICNAHYRYFLSQRFPKSAWIWLGPDAFWNQGGLALGVFPIEKGQEKIFQNWLEVDRYFHSNSVVFYSDPSTLQVKRTLQEFLDSEGRMKNDPFLNSIFCEKAIFYQRDKLPPSQLLPWLQKAVEKGYPAPHLLVTEGLLLSSLGRTNEGREALERAVRSPLDMTSARRILTAMEERKKPMSRGQTGSM